MCSNSRGRPAAALSSQFSEDQSVLIPGTADDTDDYHLTGLSSLTTIRSVRLEVLTHDSLPNKGPGRADNGNFVLSRVLVSNR